MLRGSYDITYVPIGIQFWEGICYGFAPRYTGTNSVPTPFNWDSGYPGVLVPGSKQTELSPYQFPIVNIDPNSLKASYTHNFNFGVQYELGRDTRLEVSYVGNRGRRLPDGTLTPNEATPSKFLPLLNSGHLYDYVCDPASAAAAGVPYPYRGFCSYAWAAIAPWPQAASVTANFSYPALYFVGRPLAKSTYNSLVTEVVKRAGAG